MTEASTGANEDGLIKFSLGKVYLKDASLEAPNSPDAFLDESDWNPKVTLQYKIDTRDISDDKHDVLLTVTITAAEDTRTIFLVEVQQGGIFLIRDANDPARVERILNVRCPKILFPYARESIDSLIVKAGFAPLMLNPLDFALAYDRKRANANTAGQASGQDAAE